MEKSNLFLELHSDVNATGSASWAFGNAHVLAAIYGPKEANMANELTHRACIDVSVLPVSGMHSPYESEMEFYLLQLLERLIDVKAYPRCQLNVRLQVVTGTPGHPSTMAACINALSLALLQTSIPLKASVVAVCTSEIDSESRPLALTIDIAHPNVSSDLKTKRFKKESSGDGKTHTPLVFAVYSGRPQVLQGTLATISPEKLISFTSSPENEQTGLLCSRARDLFEAMVNQVSAVQA